MPRVTVVNPEQLALPEPAAAAAPRKKRGKKKQRQTTTEGCMTTKRDSKGRFMKKGAKKAAARRKNPGARSGGEIVVANPKKPRRRRRNPGLRGAMGSAFRNLWPRLLAHLSLAALLRNLGQEWGKGILGGKVTSPYAGEAWGLGNYIAGLLLAVWGGKALDSMRPGWGEIYQQTIMDSLMVRLVWTEMIGSSKTATKYLGNVDAMIPTGWRDDAYGNRWAVLPSGDEQSMLGLVAASPLDGVVQASPLDGMGHYPDPYLQRGANDPYAAAYM